MYFIIMDNGIEAIDFLKDENDKILHFENEEDADNVAREKDQSVNGAFNFTVYEL